MAEQNDKDDFNQKVKHQDRYDKLIAKIIKKQMDADNEIDQKLKQAMSQNSYRANIAKSFAMPSFHRKMLSKNDKMKRNHFSTKLARNGNSLLRLPTKRYQTGRSSSQNNADSGSAKLYPSKMQLATLSYAVQHLTKCMDKKKSLKENRSEDDLESFYYYPWECISIYRPLSSLDLVIVNNEHMFALIHYLCHIIKMGKLNEQDENTYKRREKHIS
jgi:hypothetical protein